MEALDTGSSAAGASSVQAFSSTSSSPSPSSSSSSSSAAAGAAASSSSSSAFAGGPLVSSSDANPRNSSLNAALARDASSLFHSSRYQECIDLLHQILLSDHENPKVSLPSSFQIPASRVYSTVCWAIVFMATGRQIGKVVYFAQYWKATLLEFQIDLLLPTFHVITFL